MGKNKFDIWAIRSADIGHGDQGQVDAPCKLDHTFGGNEKWEEAHVGVVIAGEPTTDGSAQPATSAAGGAQSPVGVAHVLSMLTMVKTNTSFKSWSAWMATVSLFGGDITPGNLSEKVCARLVASAAGYERFLTKRFLMHASVISLAMDARDDCLLMRCRMVLWRLPPEVATPFGKRTHGVEPLARGGPPWVVERVVGVARLGADRSATASAKQACDLIKETCVTEKDFDIVKPKVFSL